MAKCNAPILDRCVSVLTYFTFGIAGLVWLLIVHFSGNRLKNFSAFHIYQSIFLNILLTAASLLFKFLFSLFYSVPFLGPYVKKLFIFLVQTPLYLPPLNFSILYAIVFVLLCYLSAGAVIGKLSYVPGISDIIKSNLDWSKE